MTTILLEGENESSIKLLVALAQKLGLKTRALNKADMEDLQLAQLMQKNETGEYVAESEVLY